MQEGNFKDILKGLNQSMKSLEKLTSQFNSEVNKRIDSLDDEGKNLVAKVVKESSDIVNNKDMSLADKLNELTKLRNKHGDSTDNK